MEQNFEIIDWAKKAVLYEVNIRQYTPEGNFVSFSKYLPRLKEMGITILWFMPITPISEEKRLGSLGSYYACSNYTEINSEFGSLNDFKNLINQAHNLGMKVIIDWVANHTGYDHHWTKENPEWYIHDEDGNFVEKNGWKDVIDLDYSNQAMRNEMLCSLKFWINECGIDGFRCDMAHLVPLDFWLSARQECDKIKKLFWLAECDEKEYQKVFDVTYAWNWMHATEKLLKNEIKPNAIQDVLRDYGNNLKLFFTSNHDENSWNGTEIEKYGILTKALTVFTFAWHGMPLVYSGQEIPNQKRLKFFDKDFINWNQDLNFEKLYQQLSALHQLDVIYFGETIQLASDETGSIFSFIRKLNEEYVLVILNLSNKNKIKYSISHQLLKGKFSSLFSALEYDFNENEAFELLPGDYLVYKNIF